MNEYYNLKGPAVMLGDPESLFPRQLASYWRSLGMEVVIISWNPGQNEILPDGTRIIRSSEFKATGVHRWSRGMFKALSYVERLVVPLFRHRYRKITGRGGKPWASYLIPFLREAFPVVRAVRSMKPRFVFGHEVSTYGIPTVFCKEVPKILLPWGGDIYLSAEASPFFYYLIKYSLQHADLIVPSSTAGAHHICERFNIPASKVRAVSWGVDRELFKKADEGRREAICLKWGIDRRWRIILNSRRFHPMWGCFVALDAFKRLANEMPAIHFIMLGGVLTEPYVQQARAEITKAGLSSRFSIMEGDVPLNIVAELMSISDIFVSLLGRGDMRSGSVLQATAAGGIPVISDLPEYREMGRLGFSGFFVNPEKAEDVLEALRFCLKHPERMSEIRIQNDAYIAKYEDNKKQMDMLLRMIEEVCLKYSCSSAC